MDALMFHRLSLSFALPLAALLAAAPLQAQQSQFPAWLAGTWAMEDGSAWADKVWTAPRGKMMLGMGREGFGPDVESWESTRIERKADGSISYFSQPRGGAVAEYPIAVASDQAIEFANAGQKFPQRIRFWREGQLLMVELARIDGSDAVRYNFRPVATGPEERLALDGGLQSP